MAGWMCSVCFTNNTSASQRCINIKCQLSSKMFGVSLLSSKEVREKVKRLADYEMLIAIKQAEEDDETKAMPPPPPPPASPPATPASPLAPPPKPSKAESKAESQSERSTPSTPKKRVVRALFGFDIPTNDRPSQHTRRATAWEQAVDELFETLTYEEFLDIFASV